MKLPSSRRGLEAFSAEGGFEDACKEALQQRFGHV